MPELPEVQTIADDLHRRVSGRKITSVWYDTPRAVKYPKSAKEFERQIKGARILRVERRGKYIKFILDRGRVMLVHPKMTGHFLIGRWRIPSVGKKKKVRSLNLGALQHKVNSHIHFIFHLDNGRMLSFCDARKFGTIRVGQEDELAQLKEMRELGPDALDPELTFNDFARAVGARRRNIKQVLLDQSVIAGLGNIYSDEALYSAKIHPLRRSNELSARELKKLFDAVRTVLKKSIKLRGTSYSDFRDTRGESGGYYAHRLVYQREGEKCRRDRGIIKRIVIGARSAHFCPHCQRAINE